MQSSRWQLIAQLPEPQQKGQAEIPLWCISTHNHFYIRIGPGLRAPPHSQLLMLHL
jgi:hypothetical protein